MKEAGSYLPNIGRILRTILIIAAIFFIVVFTFVWFGIIAGVTFSAPFLTNFFPGKESLTILMMINLLFVIGIPLVMVIITIVRLVWKRRMGRGWKTTLLILWLVNGVSLIAIGGTLAQEFVTEDEIQQLLPLDNSSETLSLGYYMPEHYDRNIKYFGGKGIQMPSVPVRYAIVKSNDQSWRLNQIVSSHGKRGEEARALAWEIELPLKIVEGSVASPEEIPFNELSKWRNQEVVLELAVPVGKFVRLGSDVMRHSSSISIDYHPKEGERLYQMSETGQLICQNCITSESDASETSIDSLSDVDGQVNEIEYFDRISLSGPMKVTIEEGENRSLRILAKEQDLANVENVQENDQLSIHLNTEQTSSPVRVFITAPLFDELTLESTDDVLLRGFTFETLNIIAKGDFELKTDIVVEELNLEAGDGVEVEFTGNAELINAELTDASRLDTDRGNVVGISFNLEGNSRLKLGAGINIIKQNSDEGSSFRIVD